MIIPDLQKELDYWVEKLRLGGWKIKIRYEPDPRHPATGAPVYGYTSRQTDIPSAEIVIRTPTTAADIAETHDTIVHELLHCRLANPEGSIMAEENAVWTLAPLLTELRLNAPAKATILCKALARRGTPITLKERYAKMDPEKLAALAMQAGQLIAEEGLPENVKALLQELIALAAGGPAPMPEEEGVPVPPIEGKTPEEPQMGLSKEEDKVKAAAKVKADVSALLAKMHATLGDALGGTSGDIQLKALEEKMAADRAAAVDGLLDTRTDLQPAQREHGRILGVEKGVAALRKYLGEVVPAKHAEKTEVRAKLGEEKAIRGGSTLAKAAPSGDTRVDALFRIVNKDTTRDGVIIPPENSGRLVEFSVVEAYSHVKYNAEQAREQLRAKMGGTR